MTKGKRSRPKRRYFSKMRKHYSAKIPLEVAIAAGTLPFVPVADGWNTPFNYVQAGDFDGLGKGLLKATTGIDLTGAGTNVLSVLNPFDLNSARFTKVLILAGLAHKVRTKFVKIPMNKIPFIGKYVS